VVDNTRDEGGRKVKKKEAELPQRIRRFKTLAHQQININIAMHERDAVHSLIRRLCFDESTPNEIIADALFFLCQTVLKRPSDLQLDKVEELLLLYHSTANLILRSQSSTLEKQVLMGLISFKPVALNSDSHLVPETLRCIQRLLSAQSVCPDPALFGEAGAHHEPSLFQRSEDFPQCSLSRPLPSAVSLEPDPTASNPSLPASLLAVSCNARITAGRDADKGVSVWHAELLSPSGRERQPVGRPAAP
jgi:hypothetical protein